VTRPAPVGRRSRTGSCRCAAPPRMKSDEATVASPPARPVVMSARSGRSPALGSSYSRAFQPHGQLQCGFRPRFSDGVAADSHRFPGAPVGHPGANSGQTLAEPPAGRKHPASTQNFGTQRGRVDQKSRLPIRPGGHRDRASLREYAAVQRSGTSRPVATKKRQLLDEIVAVTGIHRKGRHPPCCARGPGRAPPPRPGRPDATAPRSPWRPKSVASQWPHRAHRLHPFVPELLDGAATHPHGR